MKGQFELLALNRGVVSRFALARLDLKRLAMAAEEQTNWLPMELGPMTLRPGLGYTGTYPGVKRSIPFVFSIDDMAELEMSDEQLRVWVDDAVVSRGTVTATITNGTFTTDLSGWTDYDEAGATSQWGSGLMLLNGDGTTSAIREQVVTVTETGTAHAIRIEVALGPVTLRIGSSSLGSQYRKDTTLGTGIHSIVVVPTGNFYLQFRNSNERIAYVDNVSIEAAGALTLPLPYAEADLPYVRYFQSGDVVYLACRGYQQRKIERRSNGSWSVVVYQPNDGPFRILNTGPTTLACSVLNGNGTLTASNDLFDADHAGSLWRLSSSGQRVETSFSADNTFSDPIRVISVGEGRRFAITISGTFVATVTLQRSVGFVGSWEDLDTYTSATSTTYNDDLDNQIVYFRLGIKTGDYTSGTAVTTLNLSSGSITGVVRITSYVSPTSALVEVLSSLGGTDATDVWSEGLWSEFRGWPSSVQIHDSRLWWAGKDKFIGSITDSYESFDDTFEGDAGPISRTIGFGPVDTINWLLSLSRLMAGTDMAELSCRSSSFDEPLTPTNFTPKKCGTQGTANVAPIEVDNKGLFIQRGGQRLYELAYAIDTQDYNETDLTQLCPEFLSPGVSVMAVQRKPDTRIHCVRSDGTVALLVFDKAENLICWVGVETDGDVEDVMILPGSVEDSVYYTVKRTIGGVAYRYREKWALQSECRGGLTNKQADSFVYDASDASTITGLSHLEGEEVVAWAAGQDLGTFTVSGGSITLPERVGYRCAGLSYRARFKSAKLAYVVPQGRSALGAKKKVHQLGLVLLDTHAQGITYGGDFDTMDDLPQVVEGETIDTDTVHDTLENVLVTFPGNWTRDARLCLEANAPRPATVLACVVDMSTET